MQRRTIVVQVIPAQPETAQSFPVFPAPFARPPLPGTHVYLFQNSHLGFAPSGTEGYRALLADNLLNALGNLESCCDSAEGFAVVGNNPLSYTDPSGLGIFGDIGSIIGSFFGPLGSLIGWGLGSIGDLATGQSISPPGIGIGTDIFGSIAGSVNSGQPWNEQWSIGGGGLLNTGTVFGSGDTGPFINNILMTTGGSPADIANYNAAIAYLMGDPGMARIIRRLRRSPRIYSVAFVNNGNDFYVNNSVVWDPTSSLRTVPGGGCQSAALGLGHELAHAYEEDLYPYWYTREHGIPSPAYGDQVERWATTGPEASAARTLGEPIRFNHGGTVFPDLRHEPNATSRTCGVP